MQSTAESSGTGATSTGATSTGARSTSATSTPRSTPVNGSAVAPGRAAGLGLKPVTVPVKVLRSKSSVQVLVPVTMHGKRFYFIVDTGATVTFLDSTVAKSLQLAPIGTPGKGTSIGCTSPVQPVALANWSIGGQALPGSLVPSQKTTFAGKKYQGIPIAGLLGADLYYLYGTMTLDYRKAELSLGGAAPTGKQSFPFLADVTGGGVHVIAQLTVHGVRGGFVVDTGASVTELDTEFAMKAHLSTAGPATKIGAVSCTTTVRPVHFDDATAGSVKLPATVAASSQNALTDKSGGKEQGLLGADILSTFGAVTFDFMHHTIVLG